MSSKSLEPPLKRAKNVVIRNLLSAPKENEWPRLPANETEILKLELEKKLAQLKVPRVKGSWKEMRKLSKDKRKALAREVEDKLPPDVLKKMEVARQLRSWLFIGINAVSRAIESDAVSCCLLAEDVNPSNLVKHVVQLATHSKVPVFLVEGFKKYCKDVMGFPCIALGFAKPCPPMGDNTVFTEACCLIEKFYENWTKNGNSTFASDNDAHDDPAPVGKHHSTTQTVSTITMADAQESCDFLSSVSSFHLMRRSKYERAFVPDAPSQSEDQESIPTETSSPKKTIGGKNLMKYKLPTILRVRNNPFKLKRKKKKKKAP
uniref:Ribosomal protein eL8/eL30/eS12/Gadd45 domain-containing protein n=1 Tax=Lygus hesperus TaxID=30085 RepID=A0A146LWU1_LYGHE